MKRLDRIKEELMNRRSIGIIELSEELGVSHVTVRKDLDKLQDEGFLIKSHGMVILSNKEMQESLSTDIFDEEEFGDEYVLAKLGSDLVEDGDCIFVGADVTCYLLSKFIIEKKNIRIVTNNINVVTLYKNSGNQIYFIGGEINSDTLVQYASGYSDYNFLQGIYVKKAFLGVDGIDTKVGLTINDNSLVRLYQMIHSISKEVIVFGTKNNFDKIGMYQMGKLEFASALIASSSMCDGLKEEAYNSNIKLYTNYNI
jgi:DeoR family transcriptional regulator, fructose operon transcriptional repressor